MITSDLRTRRKAIPFQAKWYDSTLSIGNKFGSAGGETSGDLSTISTGIGGSNLFNLIRYVRPAKGQLIEARLTMQATASVQAPTSLRLYKGDFDTDGITAISSYSQDRIAADWKLLMSFDNPIDYGSQDNIFLDGIDLMPLIPQQDDSDYNEDGWILGVDISSKQYTDWYLYMFKIDCTVLLGER